MNVKVSKYFEPESRKVTSSFSPASIMYLSRILSIYCRHETHLRAQAGSQKSYDNSLKWTERTHSGGSNQTSNRSTSWDPQSNNLSK
jgi:hypothetical protein